jgi:hypothetical protein
MRPRIANDIPVFTDSNGDLGLSVASDIYGPAIYWDPAKDMRFGKRGSRADATSAWFGHAVNMALPTPAARQRTVQSPVTEATIFSIIPSTALPGPAQCQTSTTSWSGSIQTMFPPFPMAAKLEAGPLGHCFCFVFSHHR